MEAYLELKAEELAKKGEYQEAIGTLLALGVRYKEKGSNSLAKKYARQSIDLINNCKISGTLKDCKPTSKEIAGVKMPELIHPSSIRAMMRPLKI